MTVCANCGLPLPHQGPCPKGQQADSDKVILQGRYHVVGQLGQGGMGTVYIARDLRLANRACVVKKLRDDFFREEDQKKAQAMFEREAQVLSTLDHPNIVHVLDYFEERGGYFLVMEYIEGLDLSGVMKERGQVFSESQVIDWAEQILGVLDYLHEHSPPVIYRDLKPSNIMLDVKGRIKLVDFGIARPFETDGEGTHVVSAGYSPPEQYWGEADRRSDIYSLGATMYFLLCGKQPQALDVSSPLKEMPALSKMIDSVVQRATAQKPEERYQSAREMLLALRPKLVPPAEITKGNRRAKATIFAALLFLSIVAVFSYTGFEEMLKRQSEERADKQALNSKLRSYSRAVEAEEKAIAAWRVQAKSQGDKATNAANMAAEEQSESSLTDPEGLSAKPNIPN